MSGSDEAFLLELVRAEPSLRPLLDEHLEDHRGQVLTHLLIADVTRHVVRNSDEPEVVNRVLARLERAYGRYELVDDVIALSFVENLPFPSEPGHSVVTLLGPRLAAEFALQRPTYH